MERRNVVALTWGTILVVVWHTMVVAGARELAGGGVIRALQDVSCPLQLSLLDHYPGGVAACRGVSESLDTCCQALLSRFGLVTSQYLRDSGNFELPGRATAQACVEAFDGKLQSQSLRAGIVPRCFSDPGPFTQGPTLCQGIQTKDDFERELGPSTLNRTCNGHLGDIRCEACNKDMASAVGKLVSLGNDSTKCLAFVVIYTAGVANRKGPYDYEVADCIVGVDGYVNSNRKSHLGLNIGIGAAIILTLSLVVAVAVYLWWQKRKQAIHVKFLERNNKMLKSMKPNTGLVWFTYDEIKSVTKNFSSKQLIGEGGFAKVYRAYLEESGLEVAVKRFNKCSPETDADFRSEVEVINSVRHRNLVVLRGCCIASTKTHGHQRLLIYDYMQNGSLHDYLFKRNDSVLEWPDRRKIALGMAKGIAYLHDDMQPAIIHRDIKSSNILLDENLEAYVADFGLARTITELASAAGHNAQYGGTFGFCAPEYALYGRISDKCDVYSFGVVLLELVSGRRALEPDAVPKENTLIVDWAWALLKEGKLSEVVDKRIRDSGGPHDVTERFVKVGILCAHPLVAFRPRMCDALKMLEGDIGIPDVPDRPLPLLSPKSNADSPRAYVVMSGGSVAPAGPFAVHCDELSASIGESTRKALENVQHILEGR